MSPSQVSALFPHHGPPSKGLQPQETHFSHARTPTFTHLRASMLRPALSSQAAPPGFRAESRLDPQQHLQPTPFLDPRLPRSLLGPTPEAGGQAPFAASLTLTSLPETAAQASILWAGEGLASCHPRGEGERGQRGPSSISARLLAFQASLALPRSTPASPAL